jgi:hypothetical protein
LEQRRNAQLQLKDDSMSLDDRVSRYIGDDWTFRIDLESADGSPFNLNGYTPRASFYQSTLPGGATDLTIENGRVEIIGPQADGRLRLVLERAYTELVRPLADDDPALTTRIILELIDADGLLQLTRILPVHPLAKRTTSILQLDETLTVVVGWQGPAGGDGLVTSVNGYSQSSVVLTAADVGAYDEGEVDALLASGLAGKQPLDATLTALAAVATAINKLIYANGTDSFATTDLSAFARSLLDDATAGDARATLGLVIGTNVQAFSAVLAATTASFLASQEAKLGNIAVTQPVDLDAIEARVIALDAAVVLKGTWDASSGAFPGSGNAQAGESWIVSVPGTVGGIAFAVNDRLIAIADNASASVFAANWFKADYTDQVLSVAGRTGAVTIASADIADMTADSRAMATAANYAAMRILLGLVVGTNVQAASANLSALAGLLSVADTLPYFSGSGAAALTVLTSAGRALLDDPSAGDQRATLGLGTMATQAASSVAITGGAAALSSNSFSVGSTQIQVSGGKVATGVPIEIVAADAVDGLSLSNGTAKRSWNLSSAIHYDWTDNAELYWGTRSASYNVTMHAGGVAKLVLAGGSDYFYPSTDNLLSIGYPGSARLANLYIVNAVTVGSDERDKIKERRIEAEEASRFIEGLDSWLYRLKVGANVPVETEDFVEVQEPVTRRVRRPAKRVEIRDGQAIEVDAFEEVEEPVFDVFPLLASDGTPKMLQVGTKKGKPVFEAETHQQPRMRTVRKPAPKTEYWPRVGASQHAGWMAQDVKAALDAIGVDCRAWCLADPADLDSAQMLRPDEMLPFVTAALRGALSRIAALESRLPK